MYLIISSTLTFSENVFKLLKGVRIKIGHLECPRLFSSSNGFKSSSFMPLCDRRKHSWKIHERSWKIHGTKVTLEITGNIRILLL